MNRSVHAERNSSSLRLQPCRDQPDTLTTYPPNPSTPNAVIQSKHLFLPSNRRACRRMRLIPNQFRHLIFLRESLARSIFVNSNALRNPSGHAHINHARLARHNVDMKSPLHIRRFSHSAANAPSSIAPSSRLFAAPTCPTTRHFERNRPTLSLPDSLLRIG